MEIKIGEYVRTKSGIIDKVDALYGIIEDTIHLEIQKWFDTHNIAKHSKNIIDLIEVGDFVNGCKVYENHKTYLTVYQKSKNSEVDYNYINHDEIKTILTHEQFEQNCYRLEEK